MRLRGRRTRGTRWRGEAVSVFSFADDSAGAIPEHNEFLFPEYEILIEPEEPECPADSSVDHDEEGGAVETSEDPEEQEELRATGGAGKI